MPRRHAPGSADDWLARASGKLLLARQPLPEGGYWEDLCYMAQQAAELAVKAVFRHRDWPFPFVHDLGHLLDELEAKGMSISEEIRAADILTIYATQMRYPGVLDYISESDFEEVLAVAEAVFRWAEYCVRERPES